MAKSAVTQLQDQIEVIRKEAFDEGYKAAMQAVRELAGRPATDTNTPTKRPTTPPAKAAPAPRQTRRARGANAALIAEVLKALPGSTGRVTDIKKGLQGKGVDLSFASIGHALGQLQARAQATVAKDSRTWSYVGAPSSRGD
jgi:hypothetical protein